MRKFKVVALSVGGLGNKIFHSQDEVTENHFDKDNLPDLIKGGFLQEIKQAEKKETVTVDEIELPKETKEAPEGSKDEKKGYDEITSNELRDYLEGKAQFNNRTPKGELYQLYLDN